MGSLLYLTGLYPLLPLFNATMTIIFTGNPVNSTTMGSYGCRTRAVEGFPKEQFHLLLPLLSLSQIIQSVVQGRTLRFFNLPRI